MALAGTFALGGRRMTAQNVPAVPDNLKVPAGATLKLRAHGAGDQVYICDGSSWTFSRPDAKLFGDAGEPIGAHFAGPTWELSDGSRVTGKVIAKAIPDPQAIPWLLLEVTGHEGSGLLSQVNLIQRIETSGGTAPAEGCDAAHKGQETRSHYAAIYLFYAGS